MTNAAASIKNESEYDLTDDIKQRYCTAHLCATQILCRAFANASHDIFNSHRTDLLLFHQLVELRQSVFHDPS